MNLYIVHFTFMKISKQLRLLVRLMILSCLFSLSMFVVSCTDMSGGGVCMLKGNITSLKTGKEMAFHLEDPVVYGAQNRMIVSNYTSGEHLLGRYYKQSKASTGVVTDMFGLYSGSVVTGGNNYTVQGVLKSNKGTVMTINIDMVREEYRRDHGIGRASDNKGNTYQVIVTPVLAKVTDYPPGY